MILEHSKEYFRFEALKGVVVVDLKDNTFYYFTVSIEKSYEFLPIKHETINETYIKFVTIVLEGAFSKRIKSPKSIIREVSSIIKDKGNK